MSWLHGLAYRVRTLLNPRRHVEEIEDEVEFHLHLEAMQRRHAAHPPMSDTTARTLARLRFGNVTWYREETRHAAGLAFLDGVVQDLRFAGRTFRRSKGFTFAAVVTLAIGIGANTAVFSVIDTWLLRPLPYADPMRLMRVSLTVPIEPGSQERANLRWSYPKFQLFGASQRVFSEVTLWTEMGVTVRSGDAVSRIDAEFTDSHYFSTLGIPLHIGRSFTRAEDAKWESSQVAVLGYDLWQRLFIADGAAIGTVLQVDGTPYTIVGVAPSTFRGLSGHASLWIPSITRPSAEIESPWGHRHVLVGRLAPGRTEADARQEAGVIGAQIDAAYPDPIRPNDKWGATATLLDETRIDRRVQRLLFILMGAVALVLLTACANVANLLLIRASGRAREIALRMSLGARRARIVRQLMVESALLATVGGVVSVMIAWVGVRALSQWHVSSLMNVTNAISVGGISESPLTIDGTALAFTAIVALGTGLLFGLVPALSATRFDRRQAVVGAAALGDGVRRRLSSRNVLTVLEVTMAVVLLAGSGLLIRSLNELLQVDPGFDGSGVLTMRVNRAPEWSRDSLSTFFDRAQERLRELPGVEAVAVSDCEPLAAGCGDGSSIALVGRSRVSRADLPGARLRWITPGWFDVMRVPLLRGRDFRRSDVVGSGLKLLVSRTAARQFWPGKGAIDQQLVINPREDGGGDTATVIGVVGDVNYATLYDEPLPTIYVSYFQVPLSFRMMFFVRMRGDWVPVANGARALLRQVAPGFPLYDVAPMDARERWMTARQRFSAQVLSLFAALALGLAAIGVYGVVSYGVAQRRRELSVRMALGARMEDIRRLVVREGLSLALIGAVCGLMAALSLSGILRNLLYGVEPTDPVTLGGIVVILIAVVVAASWVPARRAASIAPTLAMRE